MKKEHTKKKTETPHEPRKGLAHRRGELERLLSEGKQEEAKQLLREMLSAPLSDEERGALLVGFAAAYLALQNSVSATQRDALEEEIAGLEEIDRLSRDIDEKLELAKVRSSLHGTEADEEH